MIELDQVTVVYGETMISRLRRNPPGRHVALDRLNLRVDSGSCVALWGDNGAGKTTAIRALMSLVPSRGRITVNGLDAREDPRAARRNIGYVPQQLAFYEDLTATSMLRFLAGLRGAENADFTGLLHRVGLEAHAGKAVGNLSGGMRQKLALAAALLGDPPALVLDEPTANLDAVARLDFLAMLAALRDEGKTLLVTTHRHEEIATLADRVVVLKDGRAAGSHAASEWVRQELRASTLRVPLPAESIDRALTVLGEFGYSARRNGHGVLVNIRPGEKATAMGMLLREGLAPGEIEDVTLASTTDVADVALGSRTDVQHSDGTPTGVEEAQC